MRTHNSPFFHFPHRSGPLQVERRYPPLSLDTPLLAITNTPTLREAFYAFVHN